MSQDRVRDGFVSVSPQLWDPSGVGDAGLGAETGKGPCEDLRSPSEESPPCLGTHMSSGLSTPNEESRSERAKGIRTLVEDLSARRGFGNENPFKLCQRRHCRGRVRQGLVPGVRVMGVSGLRGRP